MYYLCKLEFYKWLPAVFSTRALYITQVLTLILLSQCNEMSQGEMAEFRFVAMKTKRIFFFLTWNWNKGGYNSTCEMGIIESPQNLTVHGAAKLHAATNTGWNSTSHQTEAELMSKQKGCPNWFCSCINMSTSLSSFQETALIPTDAKSLSL